MVSPDSQPHITGPASISLPNYLAIAVHHVEIFDASGEITPAPEFHITLRCQSGTLYLPDRNGNPLPDANTPQIDYRAPLAIINTALRKLEYRGQPGKADIISLMVKNPWGVEYYFYIHVAVNL